MMYVVGGVDENEIMLYNVILSLRDSLHLLFKYVVVSIRCTLLLLPSSISYAYRSAGRLWIRIERGGEYGRFEE